MNNNQGMNPNQNVNAPVTPEVPAGVPPQNQQAQILNQVNNAMPNNNQAVNQNSDSFFNPANQVNTGVNLDNEVYNDTSINDLNVDGAYNKINVAPDYVNDQKVRENMDTSKKNTVPVSKELKTVIIIAVILLIFIIVMPFLFDLVSNIRFH